MERWKPIPSLQGYEASNQGRVRSIDRIVAEHTGKVKRLRGKVLKTYNDGRYDGVKLSCGFRLIHRLIAEAWLGDVMGLTVNHLNGDGSDNRVQNLAICTLQANVQHATDTGLLKATRAPKRARKLNHGAVLAMRALRNCGFSNLELGGAFGVRPNMAWRVTTGRAW